MFWIIGFNVRKVRKIRLEASFFLTIMLLTERIHFLKSLLLSKYL